MFFSCQYSLSFQHFINLSQVLFAESRWDELVLEFRASNYELHHLHADSLLSTVLQSGLSAIKTHQCYRYLNCRGHTLTFQNAPMLQVLTGTHTLTFQNWVAQVAAQPMGFLPKRWYFPKICYAHRAQCLICRLAENSDKNISK